MGVGGSFFSGREYIGNLAEVLVYDRALDATELDWLGGSVQDKYGFMIEGAIVPEPATVFTCVAPAHQAWKAPRRAARETAGPHGS